jgi:lipopolysaccharide/colanic/teichoic acid biosynthesis glycosyltransferase/ADP-glucose pyrophosphorylase
LHYQIQVLAEVGVKRLVLCVNKDMTGQVTERLGSLPDSMEYLVRETSYGTGGSLQEVEDAIPESDFWVINGNLLPSAGLTEMLALHRDRRAVATVGVFQVREAPWEMERVEYDQKQQVKAIHRIHPAQEKRSTFRPAGLYLFHKEILKIIPASGNFDLKEQLFGELYLQGKPGRIWEMPQHSRAITSIGDFFSANLDVLKGLVSRPDRSTSGPTFADAHQVQIDPSVTVINPTVFGPDYRVGSDSVVLGPTAIGANCELASQVVINECVILDNARIGQGAYLHRCVVGYGVVVPQMASLNEVAVTRTVEKPEKTTIFAFREEGHRHPGYVAGPLEWHKVPRRFYHLVKRGLDVVLALLGLILVSPVMLAVALAVRLDSPGGIIFRQQRCGQRGRNFTMYKFRSMVANAEDIKRKLVDLNEVDGPMFKMMADPRVTRVGRFLRDTNLDELPQLWNILKGDMSLVGPRPLSPEEMRYNPMWRDARLSMRPGMTGLWQLHAHARTCFNDWIVNDLEYVRNCSVGLDFKILVMTMIKILQNKRIIVQEN